MSTKCPKCGYEWTQPGAKPVRDKVVALFDQGLSINEIAKELYKDKTYYYPIQHPANNVRLHLIKAGKLAGPKRHDPARNDAIYKARQGGATFKALGVKFGISGGRARDICYKEDRRRGVRAWSGERAWRHRLMKDGEDGV